ncbi:MAG: hypothetical protein P1U32_01550 [Legionellaceae bacterium]|nr:hypothetical protein [Legionellaceae bacterium]
MPPRKKKVKLGNTPPSGNSASASINTVTTRFFDPNRPWTDLFKTPEQRAEIERQTNEAKQKKANMLQALSKYHTSIKQEQSEIAKFNAFFAAHKPPKTACDAELDIPYLSAKTQLDQQQIKKGIKEISEELPQLAKRIDRLEALLRGRLNAQSTSSHSEPTLSLTCK